MDAAARRSRLALQQQQRQRHQQQPQRGSQKTGSVTVSFVNVSFQELVQTRRFVQIKIALQHESDETLRYWLYGRPVPVPVPPTNTNDQDSVELRTEDDDTALDMFKLSASSSPSSSLLLTRETPLHILAAAVMPPVDVVQALIVRMAKIFGTVPQDMTDVMGRTPLHVVTTFGCRSAIVRLLTKNSTAAVMQDVWQRCPLHWACTHVGQQVVVPKYCLVQSSCGGLLTVMTCRTKGVKDDTSTCAAIDNDEMVLTVDTLLRAYPEATLLRDRDGMTPLDLATEHQVDARIIALLKWTTQRLRKERENIKACRHHSDETSSTGVESFLQGYPREINLIHIPEENSDHHRPNIRSSTVLFSSRWASSSPSTATPLNRPHNEASSRRAGYCLIEM